MEFNKVVLIWENLTFDTHRWHHQVFLRILHHNACYNSTAVTFISTKINWKYSRCAMIETFHPAKGMFPGHLIFVILLNRQNVYTNFYPHKMYNVLILNFTISTKIPLKSMIFLSEISWHVRFFLHGCRSQQIWGVLLVLGLTGKAFLGGGWCLWMPHYKQETFHSHNCTEKRMWNDAVEKMQTVKFQKNGLTSKERTLIAKTNYRDRKMLLQIQILTQQS